MDNKVITGAADLVSEESDGRDMLMEIVKASVIERDGLDATSVKPSDEETLFGKKGALTAPFDVEVVCNLFDHSNSLRQNVDAYVTNIDSFGHRLEPVIDLDDDDADDMIRDAMFLETASGKDFDKVTEADLPGSKEVEERKKRLAIEMRLEKAMIENFFEFCCADTSFVDLRRKNRQDMEVLGSGYWEVIRNEDGVVAQFNYIPGFTVRLMPIDKEPRDVEVNIQISKLKSDTITMKKRFRRYVQVVRQEACFYKELGDDRVLSRESGRFYETEKMLEEEEPGTPAAHEIIQWSIHNPKSSYGVPRWIGNLLSVVGSRQSEEVNFLYFNNKGVPPLAIIVSGGRMAQGATRKIRDFIKNNIAGRKNFHSVLVIEAESSNTKGDQAGRVKIDLKPLTAAQHSDALFQKYDERNIDKVGMAFRLPRMLRGDIRDFNRSTADAALSFAEMQVFQPERQAFDFIINRRILSGELGVKYWKFVSNAPVTRDPKEMAEIIRNLANAGVITPELGLQLASDVFNRDFKKIKADWTKQPIPLTVAGIPFPGTTEDPRTNKADLSTGDLATGDRERNQ